MKKLTILLVVIFVLGLYGHGWAVNYYACQAAQTIDGNSTWCTAATAGHSCSKFTGSYTPYSTLTSSDTLYTNGCTVTIPDRTPAYLGTFVKLSNKTDSVTLADGNPTSDGGQFTATVTGFTNAPTLTVTTLETGATTGSALSITGTANLSPKFTLNATNITAGTAASMYGLYVGISSAGSVNINFTNLTGGTNNSAYGIYLGGAAGTTTTIAGIGGGASTATGCTALGLYKIGAGVATYSGDCKGGSTSGCSNAGCNGTHATAVLTVTGSLIWGNNGIYSGAPASGNVVWAPAAGKYLSYPVASSAILAYPNDTDPLKANVHTGHDYIFHGVSQTAGYTCAVGGCSCAY